MRVCAAAVAWVSMYVYMFESLYRADAGCAAAGRHNAASGQEVWVKGRASVLTTSSSVGCVRIGAIGARGAGCRIEYRILVQIDTSFLIWQVRFAPFNKRYRCRRGACILPQRAAANQRPQGLKQPMIVVKGLSGQSKWRVPNKLPANAPVAKHRARLWPPRPHARATPPQPASIIII
jgi:hypothetical protein